MRENLIKLHEHQLAFSGSDSHGVIREVVTSEEQSSGYERENPGMPNRTPNFSDNGDGAQ